MGRIKALREIKGNRFWHALILLEGCARGVFHRGYTHVQVLLREDLCNRLLGSGALIVLEETPSPLPVGCLTDGLPELPREHCFVVALGYRLLLLLSAAGGSDLPGGPFRLGITHQARMETPLPEVHAPGDPGPDLLGPADAQRLCEDDMVEYKGFLGVTAPFNYPLPFHSQYGCEAAPPLLQRAWRTS